ncbi:MAG: hydroxyisourate hydrolase [Nitriliruptoraceae bacterium]|nr:hydroxyisourate hydrolase [Nitriliruptoraceae bacterium]
MSLSTHVLDLTAGRPAPDLAVRCVRVTDDGDVEVATARTDEDGRVGDLVPAGELQAGDHRLTFATGPWAAAPARESFYPEVVVTFTVTDPDQHHHVPLLLSPHGYSTYRGS